MEYLLCKKKIEGPGLQFGEDYSLKNPGGGCPSVCRTIKY